MIEGHNRFMLDLEKVQRHRLESEAFQSRMADCSLRKELKMTKRLLHALGRQFIAVGQKLQQAAQVESIEVYVPAMNAD